MKPAPHAATASPTGRPIMDQLNAVDLSRLDKLLALRQEQERLQAFKLKALEKQDQVAPAVRARVLADYERRFAALDQESAPLRASAGTEYRKLQALLQEVDRTKGIALERKQEAEFRHDVGEFDDAELASRLAEPNGILEQCEVETAALMATAKRFADALGDDIPPSSAEAEVPLPVRPEPIGAPDPAPVAAPAVAPAVAVREAAAESALPPEDYSSDTVITMPPPMPEALTVPPLPPLPPMPVESPLEGIPVFDGHHDAFAALTAGPADDPAEATFAISREAVEKHLREQSSPDETATHSASAALIFDDDGEVHEFTLTGPCNAIGRADQNQIQIVKPGISRKHALVEHTADGYLLRDLESNNGTYVNGDRVVERLLVDGDLVEVGPVKLVFRA